ncbi:acetyl-CoA C-acetyltransferase [Kineococcus sp. SYSU DK006]|uniref:acetyl-CoA C-acetyltransferase n=1 Tax=Kineococcus sp. SYSU DK006 TaxID=3383127 RepID=UPI003D7EB14A
MTRRAAIVAGNRTPFVRAGRRYAQVSAQDLLVAALDGLVARCGLAGERLGEVAAGAVLKHSRDLNLTREAVLSTALDAATPAYDVQQACATGLETAVLVANKIALGQVESGIAGGADSASDAPIALDDRLRRVLLDLSRARTPAARLAALSRLRPGQLRPVPPRNAEPRTGLSMGEHAARTAAAWGVSREAQDELALASHRNLAAAYERGFLDDLLTPYLGVRRDDLLRPDTSVEKLATLPPVFGRDLEQPATMTAGNSTPLTDGAAVVLLASDEWAAQHRLPVLAHLVDAETAAVDHVHGEGLLTAPVWAVPRLLQRNGLTLDDLDVVEVHEAFASTVLATLAAWEDEEFCRDRLGLEKALGSVDRARLNPVGSSLATGHPFAATGARILATTAKLLAERGGGRALISICAAGGQGIAALVEA